jgi:hypothetical protein
VQFAKLIGFTLNQLESNLILEDLEHLGLVCMSNVLPMVIQEAADTLTNHIDEFIAIAEKGFSVDILGQARAMSHHKVLASSVKERFFVVPCSLHRMPPDWARLHRNFRIRIGLYSSGVPLGPENESSAAALPEHTWFQSYMWKYQQILFEPLISHLPLDARICCLLLGDSIETASKHNEILAWTTVPVYNHKARLITGLFPGHVAVLSHLSRTPSCKHVGGCRSSAARPLRIQNNRRECTSSSGLCFI